MKKISLLSLTMLPLLLGSCHNDKDAEPANPACATTAPVVEQVHNSAGWIHFDEATRQLVVNYVVPGSIDSQYSGLVCSLPENLRREGQAVLFSGNYRAYTGSVKPELGGQTYFYLELTEITAK